MLDRTKEKGVQQENSWMGRLWASLSANTSESPLLHPDSGPVEPGPALGWRFQAPLSPPSSSSDVSPNNQKSF